MEIVERWFFLRAEEYLRELLSSLVFLLLFYKNKTPGTAAE